MKLTGYTFLIAVIGLVGCNRTPPASSGPTGAPSPVAGGNNTGSATDTPEAVFAAANTAQQKGDHRAFLAYLTPDAQIEMAASLASGALNQQLAAQGTDEFHNEYRVQFKPIVDALDKHGLPYAETKKFQDLLDFTPGNHEKLVRELKKMIKDPVGLYAEILEAYSKIPPLNSQSRPPEMHLTDVKVTGDTAKGTATAKVDGQDVKQPIDFVKVGGKLEKISPPPAGGPK